MPSASLCFYDIFYSLRDISPQAHIVIGRKRKTPEKLIAQNILSSTVLYSS